MASGSGLYFLLFALDEIHAFPDRHIDMSVLTHQIVSPLYVVARGGCLFDKEFKLF